MFGENETRLEPRAGRRRRRRTIALAVLGGLAVLLISATWYINSPHFREFVRAKLVHELERATGGQVELKSFAWDLTRLEFIARHLTIHGTEAANDVPYARVDRLTVRVKIISLFSRQFGLSYVGLERPVIHLIVYPDGTTNQPTPKVKREAAAKSPVDVLFDLAIDQFELRDGELIWNQQRVPLDVSARHVSAGLTYELLQKRYDGNINVGKLDSTLKSFRPFASSSEVHFSIFPKGIELKSFKWASGRSNFEASGTLREFAQPRIELTYNATLDLAEAGSIARMRALRRGTLVINGSGHYSLRELGSTGQVFLKDAAWEDATLRARDLDLHAHYSITPQRLSLSGISGEAFGGTLKGEADIHNWMIAERPVLQPGEVGSARGPQRGSATLTIRDLSVQQLAGTVLSARPALRSLQPVGTTNGTLSARWRGSPMNAEVALSFDVAAPSKPTPSQLPVSGRVRGVYHGRNRILEVSPLALSTRGARVSADGTLGREGADLKFEVHATSLEGFQPVIAALRGPAALPLELRGAASFQGTASGLVTAPTVRGRLQVTDFVTVVPVSAEAAVQDRQNARLQWDSLSADVFYSPDRFDVRNAVIQQYKTRITATAGAGLLQGKLTETSPLSGQLSVRNADIAHLQSLAGYSYPVTGIGNVDVRVSGTKGMPRLEGRLTTANASAYGEPIRSAGVNLQLANNELRVTDLAVEPAAGRITGRAAYNLKSRRYTFDLRGSGFDLARYQRLQTSQLSVAGSADLEASGRGTVKEPIINAALRVRNLVLNNERFGDLRVDAITEGNDLRLQARTNFENAALQLDGRVRMRDQWPGQLTLVLSRLDVDPLIEAFLKTQVTGHSRLAGRLEVNGPLRQPLRLNAVGELSEFVAELENIHLENQGPIHFSLANQALRLDQFHLVGDDTDFTARGTVQLAPPRRLDVRADGRVNLRLLQSFNRDLRSYGVATVAVNIGGILADPRLQGQLQISNAGMALIDLPNAVSEINGTLVFNEDRLQVQKLTAKTGGGTLNLGGFITYAREINFNLTAAGNDIRLRYEGMSAIGNMNLRLSGSWRDSLLSGDVTVTRFAMNPQFDFALYLARSKQPPPIPDPESPLNNMRLDVHVTTAPDLQIQTSMAKLSGNADMRLRGTAARPAVLGRANVSEGEIFFNGTEYELERGDVVFTNPTRIEPVIDVQATTRVRQYDITLHAHGTVNQLHTTYRSEPPLPTGDIIALLAFGRTREESLAQPESFSEGASEAILGGAFDYALSKPAQRLFGVSRVKIDPQVGGARSLDARLTVEQQVSDNVTLTFITNLAESGQQVVQMEYNVNKNVSVIGVRDQNGVVAFEVLLRQRLR
jgi:translocation and assembly module TamB